MCQTCRASKAAPDPELGRLAFREGRGKAYYDALRARLPEPVLLQALLLPEGTRKALAARYRLPALAKAGGGAPEPSAVAMRGAELRLGDLLTKTFDAHAEPAVREAARVVATWPGAAFGRPGEPLPDKYHALVTDLTVYLGQKFEGLEEGNVALMVADTVAAVYSYSRAELGATVGLPAPSFTLADKEAARVLAAHTTYWVGSYYEKQLGERVAACARYVLNSGQGREAAGKLMEQALREHFGLKANSGTVPIPGGFKGTPQQYFRGLAAVAAQRSKVISTVQGLAALRARHYVISAVMDERTSAVCQLIDGTRFAVEYGVAQAQAVLQAQTPEEAAKVGPWLSAGEVQKIIDGGTEASRADDLARAGLALPPYHFLCRTEVVLDREEREQLLGAGAAPAPEPEKPLPSPVTPEEAAASKAPGYDPRSAPVAAPYDAAGRLDKARALPWAEARGERLRARLERDLGVPFAHADFLPRLQARAAEYAKTLPEGAALADRMLNPARHVLLAGKDPDVLHGSLPKMSPSTRQGIADACNILDYLSRYGRALDYYGRLEHVALTPLSAASRGRAFFQRGGRTKAGKDLDGYIGLDFTARDAARTREVLLHEYGHVYEAKVLDAHRLAQDWLRDRVEVNGKPWKPAMSMNALTGSTLYKPTERAHVARPGKPNFASPYVGKDYGGHASEVTSMAFQDLGREKDAPVYRADPNHFHSFLGSLNAHTLGGSGKDGLRER